MSMMVAKTKLKRRGVLNEGIGKTCALVAAIGLAACSSALDDVGCTGNGVACPPITDIGSVITPTCSTATPPTAVGGTYADGTYVLTAETYYQSASCVPGSPSSQTVVVAGGCEAWAAISAADPDAGVNSGSTTFVTQGNQITGCEIGPETFSATATTLTFFYPCGDGDKECVAVDVYTKR
jgi:hypothetical protein